MRATIVRRQEWELQRCGRCDVVAATTAAVSRRRMYRFSQGPNAWLRFRVNRMKTAFFSLF